MKVLGFGASNSKTSINQQLVKYALTKIKARQPEATFDLIELIDYELPLYRPDRESEQGIPEMARNFFEKITASDAVIISFAEHNGLYTAVYKNLFDWASRIDQKVYQNKPMLLMATSPGGRGAANVLRIATESAPHFAMDVKATLSVPSFQENFDSESGKLTNEELDSELDKAIDSLLA